MKNVLTALSLAFMLSLDTFAAIPSSPASGLKEVRKHYKDVKTLRCDFTEQFQWQLTGETVERNGTIVVDEGDRFRVETPEQIIVSDGKSLYRHNLVRHQVMIESVGSTEGLLPSRLLLDFGSEFEAIGIAPIKVIDREGFRLDLKPKKADEALLQSASIWVTADDLIVRKMQILDLNQNRTTYILHSVVLDKPVDPAETKFTQPEGVEVFDLRK